MVAMDLAQIALFETFARSGKTLIADTNASSRQRMAAILSSLGARGVDLVLVSNYDDAKTFLNEETPKLILSDFNLGAMSGLDLLQMRRARDSNSKDCVFALVTGNSSQSAVAQAAEEDVDTFILKPYTIESFKRTLVTAVTTKINPTPYIQAIENGKETIAAGNLEKAEELLKSALQLDPKPSLAWFYLGQLKIIQKAVDNATTDYKNGLQFNGIHYKCLVGLHEILLQRKRYGEAYQIVRKLARYFPANPNRLSEVVSLAVKTRNFQDIIEYYEIFKAMETRSDRLVTHICAGMNVYAKLNLMRENPEVAIDIFEKVAVSSAGRTGLLRYAVETLVKFELIDEASKFLQRFPGHTRNQRDYLAAEYLIQSVLETPDRLIHMGRKLLAANVVDPAIHEIFISSMIQYGMHDEAEEAMRKAFELFPSENERFRQTVLTPERQAAA